MEKVTKNESVKRFASLCTVCNILGAIINFAANDTWTGIIFCAAAVSTFMLYVNEVRDND